MTRHRPVIASLATLSIVYGKRDTFRCAFCGRQAIVLGSLGPGETGLIRTCR